MSIEQNERKTIEKVLDKLPYSDGSFRRRLVSGGIVLVGIIIVCLLLSNPESFKELPIGNLTIKDFITSPIIAGVVILFVYALGNLVELFGEIFLVRSASGIFWALKFPLRKVKKEKEEKDKHHKIIIRSKIARFIFRGILWILLVPFLIIFHVVMGFFGYTSYKIHIYSDLSDRAKKLYEELPDKVELGLRQPVGDNTETAWKFLVDEFDLEQDQKWARRNISRVKEVLAVTTAIIIFFICIAVAFTSKVTQTRLIPKDSTNEVIDSLKELRERAHSVYEAYEEIVTENSIQVEDEIVQESHMPNIFIDAPSVLTNKRITIREAIQLADRYNTPVTRMGLIFINMIHEQRDELNSYVEELFKERERYRSLTGRDPIRIPILSFLEEPATPKELNRLITPEEELKRFSKVLRDWKNAIQESTENIRRPSPNPQEPTKDRVRDMNEDLEYIEITRDKVDRCVRLLDEALKTHEKKYLTDQQHQDLIKQSIRHREKIEALKIKDQRRRSALVFIVAGAIPIPAMFIYIAFFLTLRNVIKSILEILAITNDKEKKKKIEDNTRNKQA